MEPDTTPNSAPVAPVGAQRIVGQSLTHTKDGLRVPLDMPSFGHWLSHACNRPASGLTPEQWRPIASLENLYQAVPHPGHRAGIVVVDQ